MDEPAKPGDRVGRYVIEAILGAGGMGHVYRAYDELLRRRVALKLIRAEAVAGQSQGSAPTIARVLREARMAAAFDHPNVVGIFDLGEDAGRPFIVMEHVTGRTLRTFVGDGSIPPEERVRWLADVARALAAAHRAGLVHRDVKPENVMVREDGVVKVLDFGIARRATSGTGTSLATSDLSADELGKTIGSTLATQDGRIVGTPAYMAPETIARGQADARCDQFAWGVVAYELLAGRVPWKDLSGPVEVLVSVVRDVPARLSAADLGVDANVVEAIHRALEKDPERRFPTMDQIVATIGGQHDTRRGAATIRPPGAVPSGPTDPTLAAESAVAAALVESAAAPISSTLRADRPRPRPRRALLVVAAGAIVAIALAAIGLRVRASHRREATPFAPSNVHRVTFSPGCEEYPSLDPSGQSIVFDGASGSDYHVFVLDTATNARREITHEGGWQFAPSLSPDGRTVAYLALEGEERVAKLVPFDGSSPPRRLAAGWVRPAWSPDGKAVWAGRVDVGATRFDVASGTPGRTVRAPPGSHLATLLELPDGRVVAAIFDDLSRHGTKLVTYDPGTDAPRTIFEGNIEEALARAPDPDRVLFAREAQSGKLELWSVRLDGADPARVAGADVEPTKGMVVARDGRFAIWSTCDTSTELVSLVHGDAGKLVSRPLFPSSPWRDVSPAWIQGSDFVVVASDRAGRSQPWILDRTNRTAPRPLRTDLLDVETLAVSPDGAAIAVSDTPGRLRVARVDGTGAPIELVAKDAAYPSFSRDGGSIYFETHGTDGLARIAVVPGGGGVARTLVAAPSGFPAASPTDDRVAYVALAHRDEGRPMILDVATGKSQPVSPALGVSRVTALRFSPDGKRLAIAAGPTEVVEVEVASGDVLGRFDTGGDEINSLAWVGGDILAGRIAWSGDLWMGERPFGAK